MKEDDDDEDGEEEEEEEEEDISSLYEEIVVDEYGRSVSVGESELLSRAKYTTTIRAVRDTQVAQVPESVFTYITRKHPEVLSHVTRLVAQRMAREHGSGGNGMTRRPSSLSTVALLPVSDGMTVIFAHFVSTLELALGHACSVRVLNSAAMDTELRRGTFDMISFDDVRFGSWLAEQEEADSIILYQVRQIFIILVSIFSVATHIYTEIYEKLHLAET
jgi:lysophospholipid hydrolase